MHCFLEINTGTGEYTKVVNFGRYTPQMEAFLIASGNPGLLVGSNLSSAADTAARIPSAIEQLRVQFNYFSSAYQAVEYDRLIRYLEAIHAAGLVHTACVFRSTALSQQTPSE